MNNLFASTGADFSPCRAYRYLLWRIWDNRLPKLHFCCLNPSTADEVKNDPTVERCERRAIGYGYGGLFVTNIFAYRSTDPGKLGMIDDPVGPGNDEAIVRAAKQSKITIAAWGTHGMYRNRSNAVRKLLANFPLFCLGLTKDGFPRHPLYVSYSQLPIAFTEATSTT